MNIILLDRDGTIISEPQDGRVDTKSKIELFPETIPALKYLANNDFAVVIITNQAGIAEGRITETEFWDIHNEILAQLASIGVTILKTYMNGEGSVPGATRWRKPGPLMLLKAAEELEFNIHNVYMVGDNPSDISAAINAGCKGGILVKTGNHPVLSEEAIYTADNLMDAVRYAVSNS